MNSAKSLGAATISWTVERFASVPTTMDLARARARDGAPDGTVVVAEEMTAGRGTSGRAWAAPKGGLYLSIVLRDLPDPHLLTLALGNAVAETLEVAGVDAQLKWVNDVLVQGRKIAGILVEGESTGAHLDFLVAGIGINVNGSRDALPPALRVLATTLEDELGCDSCIPDLETLLLQSIERWVGKVREGRHADIVAAFRARDALQGQAVVVVDGKTETTGTGRGIDDRGHLRVQLKDGTLRTFQSGSAQLA